MSFKSHLPEVESCCFCVPELKVATAIIAVLGIVTSPSAAWALVRHSYVLRVSCVVTTASSRTDVVDVKFHNMFSFGFGTNAGIGPSCLGETDEKEPPKKDVLRSLEGHHDSKTFILSAKYFGWIVLCVDVIMVISCIYLIFVIFRTTSKKAVSIFMIATFVSILLSFAYAMLYVHACMKICGKFPIFEFVFALVDIVVWTYFLLVVYSFSIHE